MFEENSFQSLGAMAQTIYHSCKKKKKWEKIEWEGKAKWAGLLRLPNEER